MTKLVDPKYGCLDLDSWTIEQGIERSLGWRWCQQHGCCLLDECLVAFATLRWSAMPQHFRKRSNPDGTGMKTVPSRDCSADSSRFMNWRYTRIVDMDCLFHFLRHPVEVRSTLWIAFRRGAQINACSCKIGRVKCWTNWCYRFASWTFSTGSDSLAQKASKMRGETCCKQDVITLKGVKGWNPRS